MRYAEKSASREELIRRARLRSWRRAKRLDMLVASTLLLLLIIGWIIRLAPPQQWSRGDFSTAGHSSQA